MAKIFENEKGFRVIEVSAREMLKIGYGNICDHCVETSEIGYYVAVLNRWFCPACYEEWYKDAINYATPNNIDGRIEELNFASFIGLLGL